MPARHYPSTEELIQRAANGNAQAVSHLLVRHEKRLHSTCVPTRSVGTRGRGPVLGQDEERPDVRARPERGHEGRGGEGGERGRMRNLPQCLVAPF